MKVDEHQAHDIKSEERDPNTSGLQSLLHTSGGIPIRLQCEAWRGGEATADPELLLLQLEHLRLRMLRGFDELLCLEGLDTIEHLPHQIETVRKVLRHFRGRVLLADEVGLGKTIEACLLLREYLLRGLIKRVLILVPAQLVSQWHEELAGRFRLDFVIPPRTAESRTMEFWGENDQVLMSLASAKSKRHADCIRQVPWDLVIVDEAHHCKNRATRNWQLVNSLQRRNMFLLTATPVQNNLVELYNLLTLLEPGHLRTEADFKKQYVRRGNPRDPRNRERLRSLLGEVMIRNTRSLVQLDLPPRYAQTILAEPGEEERRLYEQVREYLRRQSAAAVPADEDGDSLSEALPEADAAAPIWSRFQIASLLGAAGSHPAALVGALSSAAMRDSEAAALAKQAAAIRRSAKDDRLLELLAQSQGHKILVFANLRRTLHHLQELLSSRGIPYSTFSGEQSAAEKDDAVAQFRDKVPVMLCSDAGGEGRNLQFATTLINFDLPWNPMRIEQRIGRVHRIGQTQEVFIFNLCTAGSLEAKILGVLNDKIRMFELVVGEVGSILGNLSEGEDFESLVLDLWIRSGSDRDLDRSFDDLGTSLVSAQEEYLQSKELDEALFGDDYE